MGNAPAEDSSEQQRYLQFGTEKKQASSAVAQNVPNVPRDEKIRIDKTIRIAVSGDVQITDLERRIIDTPDFQRLRGIRQLGSVHLVYPSALHTRFDHSLGTLAMADRMIKEIRENTYGSDEESDISSEQKTLTRIYALLHDITHVPFGHTIEDELGLFKKHDKNPDRTERFLGSTSDIGKLIQDKLGEDNYRRFLEIYKWDGTSREENLSAEDAFIYDIVSNTVCADLLDYLARDDHFCNLQLSLEYRFLKFLYIGRDQYNRRRIFIRLWKPRTTAPRRDTLTDLTRLLEARYLVAERVYFHHAKLISGAMLGRSLQEALIAKKITEEDMYGYTDDTLVGTLCGLEDIEVASKLARAYHDRRLHKQLHKYTASEICAHQEQEHQYDALDNALKNVGSPGTRRQLEDKLADSIGASPGDVLIYVPPQSMNLKLADMQVLWKQTPMPLSKIDDSIVAPRLEQIVKAHESLWGVYVLTSRELNEEQNTLLHRACDVEFTASPSMVEAMRQRLYEDLIERQLRLDEIPIPEDAAEFVKLRRKAGEELAKTAKTTTAKTPLSKRMNSIIRKYF